ncbi:hypothetical protein ED312_11910 [Sinomicrobium pectinilyticum]|uniref:Uncharacterized protein n=1 Tax=Sinomicrobium pectinilyticum TaxID=1084421 RepID=A0A3N0EDN0_SINP1|nr:hypothetical protein [Sinomicrobium pectinilyticum]RNL85955.1 hypothetical protein ED312_11910 [Sinomicrobium pectinilyticum]
MNTTAIGTDKVNNTASNRTRSFILKKVMTLQVGKWYILCGLLIAISFIGIKVILGDELRILQFPYSLFLVIAVFYAGVKLIHKKYLKKSIQISIDPNIIKITYNDNGGYTKPTNDLKSIRTLHPSNKKGDIQAELIFRDHKITLTSAVNRESKEQWDAFCLHCQKKLRFVEGAVPFSIWTHNWQGTKYIEYKNPNYDE